MITKIQSKNSLVLITIEQGLFRLLLVSLPVNLGLHFVFAFSYVEGLLVDYLIPTIYVQDLILVALLAVWLFRTFSSRYAFTDFGWHLRIILVFLLIGLLSTFGSVNIFASVYGFVRLALYALFSAYVAYNYDFSKTTAVLARVFSFLLLFLGVLGILQWVLQGSVFDNYLFLGEQPYGFSTYDVAKESLFGRTVIPVQGLFRHPNVFGGFLSFLLFFVYVHKPRLWVLAFIVGVLSLLFTFSLTSFIAFFVSLLVYKLRLKPKVVLTGMLILSLLIPFFSKSFFEASPSFVDRAAQYELSYSLVKQRPLFGVGLNAFTELAGSLVRNQPVHNIFILLLTESGVFALLSFVLLVIVLLRGVPKWLQALLVQLIILGLFDHYLFTIHQTQLLFWLTAGICMAYTLSIYAQQT